MRSEGKGDLLHLILVPRCSMHMLRCLSMPSIPYCMLMPIVWNGLSMPTEGCSVHMPIIITNSKLRGVEQNCVPYMIKVILAHIPVECWFVDPYVYRFLNGERYKECLKESSPIYECSNHSRHTTNPEYLTIIGKEDHGLARTIKESIYIRV